MKKLIYIFALLLAFTSYSQNPSKLKNGVIIGDPSGSAADPTGVKEGQIYWNDTNQVFRKWDGTVWSDLVASSILEEVVNPIDVYYGTRLQPINATSGFFTSSANNNATGYYVENTSASTGAYAGFTAKGAGAAFTNALSMQHFGAGYYVPYLAGNSVIFSTEDLFFMSATNTGNIQFRLGNSVGVDITEAGTDIALDLKADRSILLPSLTNVIIDSAGDTSAVTKKWVNANLHSMLLGTTDNPNGANGNTVIQANATQFSVYEDEFDLYYNSGQNTTVLSLSDTFKNSIQVPVTITNTLTVIALDNTAINYCNMGSANSTAVYTLGTVVLGGKSRVLINRATEPTITGATKIDSPTFQVSTNMYMHVENNGTRTEFFFTKI